MLNNLNPIIGKAVIAIASTPYKCPPAPFEYAFLVEEVREHASTNITWYRPFTLLPFFQSRLFLPLHSDASSRIYYLCYAHHPYALYAFWRQERGPGLWWGNAEQKY